MEVNKRYDRVCEECFSNDSECKSHGMTGDDAKECAAFISHDPYERIQELETERDAMREALQPLKLIADLYDEDRLDEHRPSWGEPHGRLEDIEIHQGRGGKHTLSLGDCFKARAVLERFKK